MANLSFVRLVVAAAIVPIWTAAAAAATPMQEMSFMKGVWTCSISGPLGHQTEIDRNTAIGQTWIHISGDVSAGMGRPASRYDGYLGRDGVRGAWVYLFLTSSGGYGAFESATSPRSPSQHWIGVYPAHVNGSFVLHYLSPTRYVMDFPLTIGKTNAFLHQDCRHA
ncbi:MAG: hypothetical protein ABSD03_12775 [Vulcanimicrobiaceae bacterium]|jgi:hypothetical protein